MPSVDRLVSRGRPWPRGWRRGACVLVALLVAASGCGGSPTTPTPVVTRPAPDPEPPAPPAAPAPILTKLRFLAFGDSLTEGDVKLAPSLALTSGGTQSYPYKLQDLLRERYADQLPVVLNAGLGGEKAADAGPRLGDALDEANPEVVLLMDGANDLLAFGEDGVPATVDAMKDLIRAVRAHGAIPIVLTLPPQRPGMPKTSGASAVPLFNRDLIRTAAVEGVMVIDVYSQFDPSLQGPDGLHPSEAGYARIAGICFDALKAAYEQPVAPAIR